MKLPPDSYACLKTPKMPPSLLGGNSLPLSLFVTDVLEEYRVIDNRAAPKVT